MDFRVPPSFFRVNDTKMGVAAIDFPLDFFNIFQKLKLNSILSIAVALPTHPINGDGSPHIRKTSFRRHLKTGWTEGDFTFRAIVKNYGHFVATAIDIFIQ